MSKRISELTKATAVDGSEKIPFEKGNGNGYMDASQVIKEGALFFIEGNSTGTAGVWTGSSEYITEYYDGLSIVYVNRIAGASPTTLNINNLGAKTCYRNDGYSLTNHYSANSAIRLTYYNNAWRTSEYDADTISGSCSTAAATAAKTVSYSGYTLTTNNTFVVVIRYANTYNGALTLNVNGTGAKPIYINGAASSASNKTLPAGTYIVRYDGTAYHFNAEGVSPITAEKANKDASGNVITTTYATKTEVSGKVDKVAGKELSTNDFTNAYKNKLDDPATLTNVGSAQSVPANGVGWGFNNSSTTPIDGGVAGIFSANRLAFANPDCLTIEYCRADGVWHEYPNVTDEEKVMFMMGIGSKSFRCGAVSEGTQLEDKLRFTIDAQVWGQYCQIRRLYIKANTGGHANNKLTFYHSLYQSPDTWVNDGSYFNYGAPWWGSFYLAQNFGYGTATNCRKLRVVVEQGEKSWSDGGATVTGVILHAPVSYSNDKQMATDNHLYKYDWRQNAEFPNGLTALGDFHAPNVYTKAEVDAIVPRELADLSAYGIEFDTTISSPTCTRIGNLSLHRTLPVQSKMRGCLLDDNGEVAKYLDPDDWTGEVRDGSQGQVMVELPMHYRKFVTDGTKRQVWLSEYPLEGYHKVPKAYVSAYECTMDIANQTLASVRNFTPNFRGRYGNYIADWDGTYRSCLGKPVQAKSLTSCRASARKRKAGSTEWNVLTYDVYKELYWLFTVEYATLNCQLAVNNQKTSEGFRQGGLGEGLSNVTNWTVESGSYALFYTPVNTCGHTDSLGNGSGVVPVDVTDETDVVRATYNVPRYRGVENPYGHLQKWVDGVNLKINPSEANGGDGTNEVYICSDPALFQSTNYDGYDYLCNQARANGYSKEVFFGENGDIVPIATGGGSTTYFCDYNHGPSYADITTPSFRSLVVGGSANRGASTGFSYFNTQYTPSSGAADIGSRLCFIPNENVTNTGTYTKPSGGIPATDFTQAVQTILNNAITQYATMANMETSEYPLKAKDIYTLLVTEFMNMYVKPSGGIPLTDLAQAVQTKINGALQEEQFLGVLETLNDIIAEFVALNPYVLPEGGIPATDLDTSVQASLTKADNALTSHQSIKTINGQSLVGTGNITLETGGQVTVDTQMSSTSTNAVQNKVIKGYVDDSLEGVEDLVDAVLGTPSGAVDVTHFTVGSGLEVVNGVLQCSFVPTRYYTGSSAPINSQGNNGDLYFQLD